jgi:hypothetical protein
LQARVALSSLRNRVLLLILVANTDQSGRRKVKKLTDRQKSRLWEQQRNVNFQASRRLEGVESPLVTLNPAEALARLEELRRHYER